jgi:hypothetical protein
MGTPFTSARNGLWDASDVDTWGQGAGVYPQTAADVVNIGHTVTYNKVSTTEMGAVTINNGGILTFLNSMSTKLTLGHVDILVNNGGELRVGSSGAGIIPYSYTAELVWHTTADNAKGINVANGGKLTIYGDPAYYGSKYDYILATQVVIPAATNAVTVTITGNYQANFIAGQELLIHKGGAYASSTNDFARLAVVSAANNGANTDIACTVTERPAALTCLVGADVLNVSRNVLCYLLSYNANLGQNNSNRPRMSNSNATGTTNVNVNDASFGGWYTALHGVGSFSGVVRNGSVGATLTKGQFTGISTSMVYACQSSGSSTITVIVASSGYGVSNCANCIINGSIYGCGSAAIRDTNVVGCTINSNMYSNSSGLRGSQGLIIKGNFDYDSNGVEKDNSADFDFLNGLPPTLVNLLNTKLKSSPSFSTNRNSLLYPGRFRFEHYGQVANAHYIADAYGDLTKVSSGWTGTPPSGVANCVKVATTQNNLGATSYLDVITQGLFRVWQKAGTVVYKVYIQAPTANNSNYAAADLVFYADYLDQATGGHLATANSTGGITKADNWTQSLTVSVTSAADGWVTLYMRLLKYYAAADVFYVDPGLWAGGNILMGDWSYGELVFPGTTGDFLVNPGLSGGLR